MEKLIFNFGRRVLLKRRKNPVDRLGEWFIAHLRGSRGLPSSVVRIREKLRVAILSPADMERDLYQQFLWGDTWVKYELTKALGRKGFAIVSPDDEPDVAIHLYGKPMSLPSRAFNIIWVYSRPDTVTPEFLSKYDRVFTLSDRFTEKLRVQGVNAGTVLPATAKRPHNCDSIHDVVFVGNAHSNGRRRIVDEIGDPDFEFRVWGRGYKHLDSRFWAGEYTDYAKLDELYASSRIVLCDHTHSMASEGFVAVRIPDILASGGFCISDLNPGITALFGDTVPQYATAQDLRDLITYYLRHDKEREAKADAARHIALELTWERAAAALAFSFPQVELK